MAGARLFVNEKAIKKNGKVAVYAVVHLANKTVKINTGVSVRLEQFDKAKGRVRGTDKDAKDANLIIDKCLSAINEIFVRYRLQHKVLTPDLLLREYHNPTNYINFYSWLEKKIDERVKAKDISDVSGIHHKVLLHKLQTYKPELSFAEIDLKFISLFRNWLRGKDNGNGPNTIQKQLGYFRAYLNIAVREGIISNNPLDFMELRRVPVSIVFLTETELNKLIEFYNNGQFQENLHKTLRHFLFMCLTGVRISDLKRLRKENIGENCLHFVPYKTRNKKEIEIHVPLIDKAQKLIHDENSATGFLFNAYSDQKMNEYLKQIADMAGIKKRLRNHAGRHTFATLFLSKTHDVATLQKLLGHSNISETMKYVHISREGINEQMAVFDKLLKLK